MLANFFRFVLFVGVFAPYLSLAQGINTPYSILGPGEVYYRGNVRNIGMGGMGVSAGSPAYGNVINPALIYKNSLTSFDIGYSAVIKDLSDNVGNAQRAVGGQLTNTQFAFPVTKHWVTAIGLRPLTQVNYTARQISQIPNRPDFVEYTYRGEGGINQINFSNGVKVGKKFLVGGSINYNFGSTIYEARSQVGGSVADVLANVYNRVTYSDFSLTGGALYSDSIRNGRFFNVGITYDLPTKLNASRLYSTQRRSLSDILLTADTLIRDADGSVNIPGSLIVGLSLEKPFYHTIGIDAGFQQWSAYQNFARAGQAANSYYVSTGGEWTPDPAAIKGYFKRVTYRAGVRFEQTPWQVEGTQVQDIQFTTGFSLPVSRGFSTFNLALVYGERGFNADYMIREKYFRVFFGVTINDRWFVRRKYN